MHSVEDLWQRHHPAAGYPPGVIAVPAPIPGVAFFPGGYGLWRPEIGEPLPRPPIGQIMVLGHDFHSESGYLESIVRTRESELQPTWRNLLDLFRRVGIAPERCFFTNVYMGLRAGTRTAGPFPGASDAAFVAHCEVFLLEQLRVMRPSLIVTLGINVPPVLGRVVPGLKMWTEARGVRHLDATGPVQTQVEIPSDPTFRATVVALIHPSLRHASLRHRHYRGMIGDAAEVRMLKDALASVNEKVSRHESAPRRLIP